MKKLSLILPVYNVEPFIARCLESCIKQDLSYDEYEIIVVNDETHDGSMDIVMKYCERYPNIRIVNRKNGGLSAARNTGLKEAVGTYVWFVDSDDRIEPNCLAMLLDKLELHSLDVLCFGLKLEYPDCSTSEYPISIKQDLKVYGGQEFICHVGVPPAAWAAIFRREFLLERKLFFFEGILHEDQEFTPRAYCLAKRIEYFATPIYYYNQREGGIMKSNCSVRRCRDLLTVADSLYEFAMSRLTKGDEAYEEMLRKVYFCITQSLAFYSTDAFPLAEYGRRPYYPMDTSIVNGPMKYKLILANQSLKLYVKVYRFLKKWQHQPFN